MSVAVGSIPGKELGTVAGTYLAHGGEYAQTELGNFTDIATMRSRIQELLINQTFRLPIMGIAPVEMPGHQWAFDFYCAQARSTVRCVLQLDWKYAVTPVGLDHLEHMLSSQNKEQAKQTVAEFSGFSDAKALRAAMNRSAENKYLRRSEKEAAFEIMTVCQFRIADVLFLDS